MSILKNMVDKTSVNYEDILNYTVDVSLSNIEQEIKSSRVVFFIPEFLNYYIPSVNDSRITVEETPVVGGTDINFIIDAVGYTGFTETLRIECSFKFPATTSTTFTSVARLFVNEEEILPPQSAPEVSLVLISNFAVTKSIFIPSTDPASSGFIIWHLVLENFGDKGAPITNFSLQDVMPSTATLAELWQIVGNDTSDNRFADTNFDGVTAVEIAQDLKSYRFDLNGTYTGTQYTIIVIGFIDENATIGQYADNFVWSSDEIPEVQREASVDIVPDDSNIFFESSSPQFVKIGNFYSTIMDFENTGNVAMENVVLTVEIPPQITPYKFNTGVFGIEDVNFLPGIPYDLEIVFIDENENTQNQILTGFNTDVNSTVTSDMITIPDGFRVYNVIAKITQFVPGIKAIESPATYAIVNNTVPSGTSIQNYSTMSWEVNGEPFTSISNSATNVNNNVGLMVVKQEVVSSLTSDITQNDIIRYRAVIQCPTSYVYEPILIEQLPDQLTYVGNEKYTYYDFQFDTTYSSDDEKFPLPILSPVIETLSTGERVVRFSYTNENLYNLKQRDTLIIEFDTKVIDQYNADPVIENFMFLGNNGEDGSVGDGIINFPDTPADYDGDGFILETLAKSNSILTNVIFTTQLDADTKTKGSENLNFVEGIIPVSTRNGSEATFRLILTNTGDKPLTNLEIIDILPYIGDTSIIRPTEQRDSQFDVTYKESEINSSVVTFTASYSDSTNPVRYDINNNTIGTGTWSETITDNPKSLKFVQNDVEFMPGDTITVDVTIITPLEKNEDLIAYNSFAIRGVYKNEQDEDTLFMPLEPYKKGIKGLGDTTISGIFFEDQNKSGIYEFGEPGLNDIVVALYNSDGEQVATTLTRKYENINGYYSFNGILEGTYYLLFTIDDRKYKFTKQVLDNELGNKANAYGFTPPVTISSQTVEIAVYAGVYDVAIENILKVNDQAKRNIRGTFYSNMALDMKLGDLINYTDIAKRLY